MNDGRRTWNLVARRKNVSRSGWFFGVWRLGGGGMDGGFSGNQTRTPRSWRLWAYQSATRSS